MRNVAPEDLSLSTPEITMHCLDWGGPLRDQGRSAGTAVLGLHGLASSCHWYDLLFPHLVDSYRCIAFDQRGHGRTAQPPTGYDWRTLSTDVVQALDQMGLDRVAILGHSWGGSVALAVAAKYPERVERLVLIDGGFLDWTSWPGATWDWFKNLLRPRPVSGRREDFLNDLRRQLAECWSDQLERVVLTMVRTGPNGGVEDILDPTNHAQVLEAMWNEPPSTMFPLVRCPTLMVPAGPRRNAEGQFARMRREMVKSAQSAIGDCTVEWIPDTIHDIGYHKPEELARVLRAFLSDE